MNLWDHGNRLIQQQALGYQEVVSREKGAGVLL